MTFSKWLLMSTAGAVTFAAPAMAQMTDTATPQAEGEDTIIVTARRQNERLQDVPASVAVITAEVIGRTGATKAEDFVRLTPGITIVTGTAEAGDTQINIRGINGARDAESSVALVVDGILKTNTAQLNQTQGTLRVVSSPLLRARQTASYVSDEVEVDERLQEIAYGEYEGRPLTEVSPSEWARWRADPQYAPEGGESLAALLARVTPALEELAAQSESLHEVIGFFELGKDAQASGAKAAKRQSAANKSVRSGGAAGPNKRRETEVSTSVVASSAGGKRNGTNGILLDLGPESVSDQEFERY